MPDGSRSFQATAPDLDLDRVARLFREHFAFVHRVLRRCGVPEAELDDAVQETFLVVHRKIDDFDGRAAETTWLYAVAVRVASTLRRSARRERARRDKAGAQMHAAATIDPEQEIGRAQAGAVLDRLLDDLDQTKRTVFVLAELEGIPVPEIARIMDANVRTTHSRLRLARERFNAALDRHHAQESGRAQRASLRTLARRATAPPPSKARARAAWAALAVRIGDGAGPTIAATGAGATTTLAATATGSVWPFVLTVGVGALVLAGVAWQLPPQPKPPRAVMNPETTQRQSMPQVETAPPLVESKHEAQSVQLADPIPTSTKPATPRARPRLEPSPKVAQPEPQDEAKPHGSSLDAESQLLKTARTHLQAGDAAAALRALGQHAAQFPDGVLAAERDATRIKALCEVGRDADARARAGTDRALLDVVAASCTN